MNAEYFDNIKKAFGTDSYDQHDMEKWVTDYLDNHDVHELKDYIEYIEAFANSLRSEIAYYFFKKNSKKEKMVV